MVAEWKADHAVGERTSVPPDGFLESRIAAMSGVSAKSTQAPLPLLRLLVRQTKWARRLAMGSPVIVGYPFGQRDRPVKV